MDRIKFSVPYGRGEITGEIPSSQLKGIYESGAGHYVPQNTETELVANAFDNPIESPSLEALAEQAGNAVIIASDHTRPVPSKVIFPELLSRLRKANPSIKISILIATGCHRGTTRNELVHKFGEEIVARETFIIHDCRDEANMVSLGRLPSGAELIINRAAVETDLLLAEGFIEPHFFAGFSGGRKSVLPGIASEITVMGNHCAKFIGSPYARAGILENNPLHRDMIFAAETAKLRFIINVVINAQKKVIHAVAGNPRQAHLKGCEFLRGLCGVRVPESDIVITSNGGYPLDQNIYQAVKGMSAAEAVCHEGGVIIMCSSCADGHGGESFYRQLADASSPLELLKTIESVPQDETVADQWEAQVLARILSRFRVIMVSEVPQKETICNMHMEYAPDLSSALARAKELAPAQPTYAVIPDGVAVIAEKV